MKSKLAAVLLILVVGVLLGLALAKWLVGAATAIFVTLIVIAVALVVYFTVRRRVRDPKEAQKPKPTAT
jgi:uncharacterized membrane protein YfcA